MQESGGGRGKCACLLRQWVGQNNTGKEGEEEGEGGGEEEEGGGGSECACLLQQRVG